MDSTIADTDNVENEIGINAVIKDYAALTDDMLKNGENNGEEEKGDSMECLRVDDENVEQLTMQEEEKKDTSEEDKKDTSGEEDLLGKQRLIMSDSEEDAADDQEIRMESIKRTQRILDSDEEDLRSSFIADRTDTQKSSTDVKLQNKSGSDSEADNIEKSINSSTHVDSDHQKDKTIFLKMKSKYNGLVDSDSEDEVNVKKSKSTNKVSNSEMDSESDVEELNKQTKLKHKQKKISALVDSDSSSDTDQSQQEESHYSDAEVPSNEAADNEAGEKKQPKQIRASAKKAMDDMQAIQSEQQRLHREAHISVPYHKPKRHTLQEFLKRRTIQKPLQSKGGSPASAVKPLKSLKMSAEELEEYAKLMEARAKEATEFFKSESEDDEPKTNNFMEETEKVKETSIQVETATEMESFRNATETESAPITESEVLTEINLDIPIATESVPITDSEVLTSQPIITEVVELPKLNINTLKIAPPTTTETIFKLIHNKQLPDSPSLKGDPNMLIDLESGDLVAKEPTGVDNLLRRFMAAKARRKPKTSETISILSTDNGKLEMSKVNIHISDDTDQNKETKPGEAYFKLQENLRSIIKKKRLDELEKKKIEKLEEEIEHNKCFDDDEDELADDETEYDSKANSKKKNKFSDDVVIDDEENTIHIEEDEETDVDDDEDNLEYEAQEGAKDTENLEGVEVMADDVDINKESDEEEDDEDDANDDDEDTDDDNNEQESQTDDNLKRKSRIIKAFQPDSDEEIDFLRTPTQIKINSDKLIDEDTTKINPINAENELLQLCSGEFEDTAPSIISQIPITQANSAAAADDELMELCSGTFEEIPVNSPTQPTAVSAATAPKCHNKIVSSDDENTNTNNETEPKRLKKLTKKAKKNKVKLGFSDDEDDEETTAALSISGDEVSLDAADIEDVPETFIDYDSEENEIVVEMTKKECVKQAENFFEKEAELSESEWGSADEDEKHLDKYDIELGDEDEFDRAKLQVELGQIHARKMLDEDIREVRKIQEMLFEDEEKDGVGRQRQFKWKNVESGFSLDDPNGEKNAHGENGESGDEENEQLWRKIRYEREQLLKEQNLKENISVTTIINSTLSTTSVGNTTISSNSVKKLNIISAKKIKSTEAKKSSPFLISKGMNATNKKPARGSFLIRDKETLSKLAGLTKGGQLDADGTAGTVAVKAIKSQNFVFATLTEEEHANLKRKSDDLLNSSTDNGINYMKKPKVEPRRGKCFIDQLL